MKKRLSLLTAFLIVILLIPRTGVSSEPQVFKLVTLGDSITKGVRTGVGPEETFAALL